MGNWVWGVLGVFGVLSDRQARPHFFVGPAWLPLAFRRVGPPFVYSQFSLSAWLLLVCVGLCVWGFIGGMGCFALCGPRFWNVAFPEGFL